MTPAEIVYWTVLVTLSSCAALVAYLVIGVLTGRFMATASKPTPPQTVTTAPQPNAKHEPRPCPHHFETFRVGGKVDVVTCTICYEVWFS